MTMIDVKKIQEEAKNEMNQEATETAKEKLKDLYRMEEKAKLALKNIQRQIQSYLNEVSELATYEAAGVNVSSGK